jgi:hypothetical protein
MFTLLADSLLPDISDKKTMNMDENGIDGGR